MPRQRPPYAPRRRPLTVPAPPDEEQHRLSFEEVRAVMENLKSGEVPDCELEDLNNFAVGTAGLLLFVQRNPYYSEDLDPAGFISTYAQLRGFAESLALCLGLLRRHVWRFQPRPGPDGRVAAEEAAAFRQARDSLYRAQGLAEDVARDAHRIIPYRPDPN